MTIKAKSNRIAEVDKIFVESAGHKLNGLTLQPFTPARLVASQAMGLKYPFIGKEGMAQIEKTGLYAGELRDLLIVLWLCSQDEGTVLESQLDPSSAYLAAQTWGAGLGLTLQTSAIFAEAVLVLEKIFAEIYSSKSETKEGPAAIAGAGSGSGLAGDESPND